MKRQRNALSPIYRLPIELLVRILHDSLPEAYQAPRFGWRETHFSRLERLQYFSRLYGLIQVSKGWEEIVKASPQLWAVVDSRYPHSVWSTALVRSQHRPLKVIMDLLEEEVLYPVWKFRPTSKSAQHDADLKAFRADTNTTMGRWQSADIIFSYNARHGLSLDLSHAHRLISLRITAVDDRDGSQEPSHLSLGVMPELRELSVISIPLGWITPVPLGLRALSLRSLSPDPFLNRMFDILRRCPNLESLDLIDLDFQDDEWPVESTPIQLLRLVRICMTGLPDGAVHAILSSIDSPYCLLYDLICDGSDSHPSQPPSSPTSHRL